MNDRGTEILHETTPEDMRNYAPIDLAKDLHEAAAENSLVSSYGLNSLNHKLSIDDQMWMRDHLNELLDNTELQNSGIQNMNKMISRFGEDVYNSSVSDKSIETLISSPRPDDVPENFYNLLQTLKTSDPDLINTGENVNDFLRKVYIRDAFDDFIRKNNVEAADVTPVTEEVGAEIQ